MYSNIMVPVDLTHRDRLSRSLDCAGELARLWSAKVTYVGVTSSAPGELAHNPKEFQEVLDGFAREQGEKFGVEAAGHAAISHDPSIDLDKTLLKATDDIGADLVVMESHVPNIADHIWHSHGGTLASNADVSVMLVRG